MDCPTCEAMVDAYVDGELSATESAAFEAALPGCPDCRRRLEETRAMSGFLRDLPVERAPDLLRAKIERELRAISSASQPQARPAARLGMGQGAPPSSPKSPVASPRTGHGGAGAHALAHPGGGAKVGLVHCGRCLDAAALPAGMARPLALHPHTPHLSSLPSLSLSLSWDRRRPRPPTTSA